MTKTVEKITPTAHQPHQADVVVIGGGIIGVSTAFFLAREGVQVVLCEKGEIGAEQSSRNWGWCRTQSRDARELPLAIESLRLWRQMDALIDGHTGFVACGILSLCQTNAQLQQAKSWLEEAKNWQLSCHLLSPEELPAHVPGLAGQWQGALFSPTDGRAEPALAAPQIARAVQRLGGAVLTHCAVRDIKKHQGQICAVETEHGLIKTDKVVLAGGVWSSLLCRKLAIRLPQLKILGHVMRSAPLPHGPEISVSGPGFGMRKREDGGYNIAFGQSNEMQIVPDSFRFFFDFLPSYLKEWRNLRLRIGRQFMQELAWQRRIQDATHELSPFEQVRILDPRPLIFDLKQADTNIKKALPLFHTAQIVERWAGLIDVTPDAVPVISPIEELPGLILSTGYSGHGFGLGPGAGRLTAELVLGKTPCVDPSPFDFRRLSRTAHHRLR